jgi:hypothetical protein
VREPHHLARSSSCRRAALSYAQAALLILVTTGCAGTTYDWAVRTTSTPLPPSVQLASLQQETIAVLTPLSFPALRGTETGMGQYLGEIIKKVAPQWQVIDEQQAINLINGNGLAADYVRMRSDAEQSHILDRDVLRRIGSSVGARYVFQPRLTYFFQIMQDRWVFPAVGVRFSQTRSSVMRLSLELWDTVSCERVWTSVAETMMSGEAVSQEPVFFEDMARVTLASVLADLLNRRTSSKYTALNQFLDRVMREGIPEEGNGDKAPPQQDRGRTEEPQK